MNVSLSFLKVSSILTFVIGLHFVWDCTAILVKPKRTESKLSGHKAHDQGLADG